MLHACTYCDVKEVLPVHVIGCSYLLIVDTVCGKKTHHLYTNTTISHSVWNDCHTTVPDSSNRVQSITLQPDKLANERSSGINIKDPTVVPVVVGYPLIEPVIPAVCTIQAETGKEATHMWHESKGNEEIKKFTCGTYYMDPQ